MATYPGEDSRLLIGDGGSAEAFTSVAQIVSIALPDVGADAVETTTLSDADQKFRKNRILRGATWTVTAQYDASVTSIASVENLASASASSSITRNFRVVLNDTSSNRPYVQIPALVTNFLVTGMEVGGNVTAEITFQKNGAITRGSTSSF